LRQRGFSSRQPVGRLPVFSLPVSGPQAKTLAAAGYNDGSTIDLNYGAFNVILKFFRYDEASNPGFSFDINLIMLIISIVLFYFYNSIKKLEKIGSADCLARVNVVFQSDGQQTAFR
jgi:hypothetical protein